MTDTETPSGDGAAPGKPEKLVLRLDPFGCPTIVDDLSVGTEELSSASSPRS